VGKGVKKSFLKPFIHLEADFSRSFIEWFSTSFCIRNPTLPPTAR